MIIAGDWALPVTSAPIRRGAVRVQGSKITSVGTLEQLTRANPSDSIHDHPGCVITPGLVNAHTHLSLSSMLGLLPPSDFATWISHMAGPVQALSPDDFADAAAFGALECLRSGITVVGDIAYGPEAPAAAADTGIGGVFFWEVLGISADELPEALARHDFPAESSACDGRTLCGISPHAPYTSGPGLIKAAYDYARRWHYDFAIHVAESLAETRLLAAGEGPLRSAVERLGTVRYLEHLGVLKDAVAVHCVNLMPGEAELLAAHARGVVLCPRSNRYLLNGPAPVAQLRMAGVRLALGTDSLASNDVLDLFAEARELIAIDPELTSERVLRIMTIEGAQVLGVDRDYGSLEAGKHADLVAIQIADTDDPIGALVTRGAPEHIRSVVTGGIWRLIDGRMAFLTKEIEQKSARVAEKAARALRGA
jgi:cytosine/adenosine deaminase-related metal-dependent hydrolase